MKQGSDRHTHTHTHACTYACMHARTHACTHARTHVRTHTHTSTQPNSCEPSRDLLTFIKLGVRSLANASRARQFNPLNPPGVGWVPLLQTNMAAVVGRAWSWVRGRARSVVRGRVCVVGHAWSCMVVRSRAWSCVVVRGRVRSCRSARFAASTAVTRTKEGTNNI